MWDVGGQEKFRESWSTYYAGARGLLFVVDATDDERMPVAKAEPVTTLIRLVARSFLLRLVRELG
jgi:GTPase SAR1 family protein